MKRYRILFCLWLAFLLGIWIFGSSNIALYAAAMFASIACIGAGVILLRRKREE